MELEEQVKNLKEVLELDDQILKTLEYEIENLRQIISNNDKVLENTIKQHEIEITKLKDKYKKRRFGIGFQAGYGFIINENSNYYIGIGLSYNFIRF